VGMKNDPKIFVMKYRRKVNMFEEDFVQQLDHTIRCIVLVKKLRELREFLRMWMRER
jgi:hypothetical protein